MIELRGTRVLVKRKPERLASTISGLVVVQDDDSGAASHFATVISTGKLRHCSLAAGTEVITTQYSGLPLTYEGEDLFILDEADVLAVVDSKE